MPDVTQTALARHIASFRDKESRKAWLAAVHPLVSRFSAQWQLLTDAYEGDGGFLDGGYLWRFPAEIADDFSARCAHARYHNFLETLVDIYVRHVCGRGVTRTTTNEELQTWWSDVDGAGTSMAEFIKKVAAQGLVAGHCAALCDKTTETPVGPAKADERARVIATVFPADSVLDWRLSRAELTAVKLLEAAPEPDITDAVEDAVPQYAIWTKDEFVRLDEDGNVISQGEHGLGLVPLAVVRPKPSKRHAFIGRPLVRADVIRALYNRASEEDHVMRNQGFSLLTVNVPHEADDAAVEHAQAQVEKNYGVTRALVTRGAVSYASPDMSIPATIRENIEFLIRELYRAAHVAWQRDSADAESAESVRLKHTELNEMLRALAQELAALETRLARFYFGWTSATPQQAETAFEQAEVAIQYPTEFFTQELQVDLEAFIKSERFGLPDLMIKRLRKRLVRRLEPEIPDDVAEAIDKAIDATPAKPVGGQTGDPGDADDLRARARRRLEAFVREDEAGGAAA